MLNGTHAVCRLPSQQPVPSPQGWDSMVKMPKPIIPAGEFRPCQSHVLVRREHCRARYLKAEWPIQLLVDTDSRIDSTWTGTPGNTLQVALDLPHARRVSMKLLDTYFGLAHSGRNCLQLTARFFLGQRGNIISPDDTVSTMNWAPTITISSLAATRRPAALPFSALLLLGRQSSIVNCSRTSKTND